MSASLWVIYLVGALSGAMVLYIVRELVALIREAIAEYADEYREYRAQRSGCTCAEPLHDGRPVTPCPKHGLAA